jgi:hypothetical protein
LYMLWNALLIAGNANNYPSKRHRRPSIDVDSVHKTLFLVYPIKERLSQVKKPGAMPLWN